jgi:hypothetical protein
MLLHSAGRAHKALFSVSMSSQRQPLQRATTSNKVPRNFEALHAAPRVRFQSNCSSLDEDGFLQRRVSMQLPLLRGAPGGVHCVGGASPTFSSPQRQLGPGVFPSESSVGEMYSLMLCEASVLRFSASPYLGGKGKQNLETCRRRLSRECCTM